jgi:hypothetical protein
MPACQKARFGQHFAQLRTYVPRLLGGTDLPSRGVWAIMPAALVSQLYAWPAPAGAAGEDRSFMGRITPIGRRVELVSMDPHFHDISIALYRQDADDGAVGYLVHTYSGREGAAGRIAQVVAAMRAMGGMEPVPGNAQLLRFPCGEAHQFACRRLFLEACKLAPDAASAAKPLEVFDKKAEQTILARSSGGGAYSLGIKGDGANGAQRAAVVARGLVKLAEMDADDDRPYEVAFACGHAHDALVGLLMGRALNVRAAMREVEEQAARGVLAAPSAQKQ